MLVLLLAHTVTSSQTLEAQAKPISPLIFMVMGDMPYTKKEQQLLSAPNGAIYRQLNQLQPAVLIHVGDIKSGGDACTDKALLNSRTLMLALYPNRLVYTPGDNEWTDCDRRFLMPSFDELERLAFVKKHFFEQQGLSLASKVNGLVR